MAMIFLSYSREDLATMHLIKQALQQTGASVWTDENLTPGTSNWTKAIDKALRECNAVVTLLSPTAYHSKWVDSECGKAAAYGKEIFPILIEGDPRDAVPLSLWGIQRIDLREDFDAGIRELIEVLLFRGYCSANVISRKQEQISFSTVDDNEKAARKVVTSTRTVKKGKSGKEQKRLRRSGILISVGLLLLIVFWVLINTGVLNINFSRGVTEKVVSTEIINTHLSSVPTPGMDQDNNWNVDGMEMVHVPAGTFMMGSSNEQIDYLLYEYGDWEREWFGEEKPAHEVYLDGYWIDQYEVTNEQFAICVAAGECGPPEHREYFNDSQYANHPVVYVNWYHAEKYCAWAGRRLPTEAEWEKAARGTDGRIFPWGDDLPNENWLNYSGNEAGTKPVGRFSDGISPYGALDMAGNVWEWTADWHDGAYYGQSSAKNPTGPITGGYRVFRGGAWSDDDWGVRVTIRSGNTPSESHDFVGFRCAVSAADLE